MTDKILKYQEVDVALHKLQEKLNNNESYKKINASREVAKNMQVKMLKLNSDAQNLALELEKLLAVKEKGIKAVEKHLNSNSDNMLKETLERVNQTNKQLTELAIRIKNNEIKMRNLLKEYEDARKQIIDSKKIHDANKQNIENLQTTLAPEIEKLKKELIVLEKNVEPEVLAKYKQLKRENVFPAFVKIDGKNCGFCRVELPIHKLEKLRLNGVTECEHCRKINYDSVDKK